MLFVQIYQQELNNLNFYKYKKMATLEDIFTPLERNSFIYYKEHESPLVRPLMICFLDNHELDKGKDDYERINGQVIKIRKKITVAENLKIKHYLKIGEECPICYEPIWKKREAYLTPCGHPFHYKCLYEYEKVKILFEGEPIWCPLCRQDVGFMENVKTRYPSSKNFSDHLEDFWMNIDLINPNICLGINEKYNKHWKGMDKNCYKCICYRMCKKYF